MPPTDSSAPAPVPAPVPIPAAPPAATALAVAPPPPRRPIKLLDPRKSFETPDTVDRMKTYLKDVPVLHARLVKVIEEQEALLANQQAALSAARASCARFDSATKQIEEIVSKWEKEQADAGRDAGPAAAHPGGAAPAAAPAPAGGAVTGG